MPSFLHSATTIAQIAQRSKPCPGGSGFFITFLRTNGGLCIHCFRFCVSLLTARVSACAQSILLNHGRSRLLLAALRRKRAAKLWERSGNDRQADCDQHKTHRFSNVSVQFFQCMNAGGRGVVDGLQPQFPWSG